jgi:hypothetical protein
MNSSNETRDLTVTEDLQHVLNVLKPKDAEAVLALKEELADNWNKKQIFRTETEMRISVLNDAVHPTPASKYWQSVREMSAHFDALMGLTFEMRRNLVKRQKLERDLKKAQTEEDDLRVIELEIDLDENLYTKATMTQIAQDRVREIQTWSKIKAELNDGSFDNQNVNTHQAGSYRATLHHRVAALNATSDSSEVINAVGPLQTVERLLTEEGGLLSFREAKKQLIQGQDQTSNQEEASL